MAKSSSNSDITHLIIERLIALATVAATYMNLLKDEER
jgi:hypothetical protein